MKNNLIKLLCLSLVLAMLAALVGCKNADDTNSSSTPTSSVESTVTSSDDVSSEEESDEETEEEIDEETDQEDEEIDEMFYFTDGGYTKLTTANATAIVRNYMNLQALHETSGGLVAGSLGIVDKFKIFEDEILKIGVSTYKKTNVKYADYKAKLLNYMSEKRFEEFWDVEEQKDGYIYISEGGLSGYTFSAFSGQFLQHENGVYTYLVTCEIDEMGSIGNCYIKANIIKENGMYVLDSYKYNSRKDVIFKGYDTLNDDTAKEIVYNYYNLLAHYFGDIEDFVDFFNVVDELKVDQKITITDGERELWKTNVKYKDLKNQLLKYVSKSIAEESFLTKDTFAEKDGYLYMAPCEGGGMYNDVLDAKLLKENNGKYEYQVKCMDETYDDAIAEFEVKATIIKQNGVYVLDDIEEIEE